jgi:hypothetical protein
MSRWHCADGQWGGRLGGGILDRNGYEDLGPAGVIKEVVLLRKRHLQSGDADHDSGLGLLHHNMQIPSMPNSHPNELE